MNETMDTDFRASVLKAAEDLIRERGAEGWSMADLAARSDQPVEDLQAEFESEWEVFCLTIRRDEERWESAIREASYKDAKERVMCLLEACVPDHDWSFWIELWSAALREERARQLRDELDQRFRALVEEIVQHGVDTGEFVVDDVRSTAVTIGTLIDAMALQATLGDTTVRPNYMFDACVAVSSALLGTQLTMPKRTEPEGG